MERSVDDPLSALFASAWGDSLAGLCEPQLELTHTFEPSSFDVSESAIVAQLEAWLLSRNQFFPLDDQAHDELTTMVDSALEALRTGAAVHSTLVRHRRDLCAFVRARLGPTPREVVAAEYSPELQLNVLGLDLDASHAPVLDIGCGASATLVRHLLARGILAHGVDRSAPSDVATRADWLEFDYASGGYRTVLSHLGLSLHFLHHHLAGRDVAYAYARCYMAILRALPPGGCFAYTPALPFIESLLDAAAYRVRAVPLSSALRPGNLGELERTSGLSLASATQIERV